jgi:glycosyltransferase involved in cell wall biosynthesis
MNGEAGLLFRPGDADALAEHMSAIWTDRELREKLVRNASRSLDRFSAETVIPRLKSLLELS